RCAGRVEVLHRRRWGSVCDDTWELADAQVICRQLGCGAALAAPGSARFGPGNDPIWLDGTHCTGEELTLAQCRLHTWGEHNCGHSEDASAICAGAAGLAPLRLAGGPHRCAQVSRGVVSTGECRCAPPQVRLVNGSSRCAGRVEVLHRRRWGSVCDDTWELADAQVICRQLGCG
ncbi:DMBT1 protein, partial [Dicrurus megarhynchus]|nr:DMBT1 protein [Dicrurus megarhynchus]